MSVFKQRQLAKQAKKGNDQTSVGGGNTQVGKGETLFGKRLALRRAAQNGDDLSTQQATTDQKTGVQDLEFFQTLVSAYVEKLREIDDIDERKPLKAEAVATLEPFVTDYVTNEAKYPNSVAVRQLIWLFDLGDISTAVPLALHLVKQGVHVTPAGFSSNLSTFVCDQVYDWANTQLKANKPAGPYLHNVVNAMLEDGWDMHEAVRGKMLAMLGKHYELAGQEQEAIQTYEMALAENEGAGVKTRLDKLKKLTGIE